MGEASAGPLEVLGEWFSWRRGVAWGGGEECRWQAALGFVAFQERVTGL